MSTTTTLPVSSRHVVAALRKGGFHAYTGPGTTGFKVWSSQYNRTPHVACYGARSVIDRNLAFGAFYDTLTQAGFVLEDHGHYWAVLGKEVAA